MSVPYETRVAVEDFGGLFYVDGSSGYHVVVFVEDMEDIGSAAVVG